MVAQASSFSMKTCSAADDPDDHVICYSERRDIATWFASRAAACMHCTMYVIRVGVVPLFYVSRRGSLGERILRQIGIHHAVDVVDTLYSWSPQVPVPQLAEGLS